MSCACTVNRVHRQCMHKFRKRLIQSDHAEHVMWPYANEANDVTRMRSRSCAPSAGRDRRVTPMEGFDWLDGETLQAEEFRMLPTSVHVSVTEEWHQWKILIGWTMFGKVFQMAKIWLPMWQQDYRGVLLVSFFSSFSSVFIFFFFFSSFCSTTAITTIVLPISCYQLPLLCSLLLLLL